MSSHRHHALTSLAHRMEEQGALEMAAADYEVLSRSLELQINLLSELNTQAMLVAGTAFGMLSSLELEAIRGEEATISSDDGEGTTLAAIYILSTSVALGSSVWVLYISNWLINNSTSAMIKARERASGGIYTIGQVSKYVEGWVGSVRFHYITSIIAVVVAAYIMVLRLLPHWSLTLLGASVALSYIAAAFVGSACGAFPHAPTMEGSGVSRQPSGLSPYTLS